MPLSPPLAVAITALSCQEFTITWQAPADVGAGIKLYRVYHNAELVGETAPHVLQLFNEIGFVAGFPIRTFQVEAVDASGATARSAITILIANACTPGWPVSFDKAGQRGTAFAIAKDTSNNTYITGYVLNSMSTTGYFLLLAKVASDGALTWCKAFPTILLPGENAAEIRGLAVDGSGNVFIAGAFSGTIDLGDGVVTSGSGINGRLDAFVAKFNSSGNFQWKQIRNQANALELIKHLAIDSAGNVLVIGREIVGFNGTRIFVQKYNTSGVEQWTKVMTGSGDQYGEGIACDGANNVWILGRYNGSFNLGCGEVVSEFPSSFQLMLGKLNGSNGDCIWSKTFGGFYGVFPAMLKIDSAGNGIVQGHFPFECNLGGSNLSSRNSSTIPCLAKYDTNGNHVWSRILSNHSGTMLSNRMDLASDDTIYAAMQMFSGQFTFAGTTYRQTGGEGIVLKFSSAGAELDGRQSANSYADVVVVGSQAHVAGHILIDRLF